MISVTTGKRGRWNVRYTISMEFPVSEISLQDIQPLILLKEDIALCTSLQLKLHRNSIDIKCFWPFIKSKRVYFFYCSNIEFLVIFRVSVFSFLGLWLWGLVAAGDLHNEAKWFISYNCFVFPNQHFIGSWIPTHCLHGFCKCVLFL